MNLHSTLRRAGGSIFVIGISLALGLLARQATAGPPKPIACVSPDYTGCEYRRPACPGNILMPNWGRTNQRNWGCNGSTVVSDTGCLVFDNGGCCTIPATPYCPPASCPCPY